MYYVVPKDRSIIKSLKAFESIYGARAFADKTKAQTGENYDVIRMERVWTTQTLDEAHLMSLDIFHMGRD